MDKVAALPAAQRGELFEATCSARGIHSAILEKDFWVCWVLKKLFASDMLRDNLVFKGGTSLAKVFHLIERFSEDIDLVLNWELLGYGPRGRDPWERQTSNTQQDRFNRDVNRRAAECIKHQLGPHVASLLGAVPGLRSNSGGRRAARSGLVAVGRIGAYGLALRARDQQGWFP